MLFGLGIYLQYWGAGGCAGIPALISDLL